MIGVLHGYSLEGSGSNLWTRYMVKALCREGDTVHLVCQEKSPQTYDFIAEAYHYGPDGAVETLFKREIPYPGRCIFHRPQLGSVLPVYVGSFLTSNPPMLPMTELEDELIEDYITRNFNIVREIVRKQRIPVLHVNHAILMSVVANRIYKEQSVPYAVMPHGSEIEYVIRKDFRFLKLAAGALKQARRIFVISSELRERVLQIFHDVHNLTERMIQLRLGVDTNLFEAIMPSERDACIQRLVQSIRILPGGKQPEITQTMLNGLENGISFERLKKILHSAGQYAARLPDVDLEQKLAKVNWDSDPILLYTGRIISGKGIHLLLAALPFIFERQPSARLLIAGSGPLREALEAFIWALHNGEMDLVQKIIDWGGLLEEGKQTPFSHIHKFYESLQQDGDLQRYFEIARTTLDPDRILFTGYLKHSELRYLFSCSDVAVFPSIVPETGPLVFLEALASGCFPIATYIAGAASQIDLVSRNLPPADAELMKIRPQEEFTIWDIVNHASVALTLQNKYRRLLREIAVQNYDWRSVALQWKQDLSS